MNVKVRPEYASLAKMDAGRIVGFRIFTLGREVPAVIVAADSPAKKAGNDLLFPACSMPCAKALEATLAHEKGLLDPKVG